jgi:hypothetical protein
MLVGVGVLLGASLTLEGRADPPRETDKGERVPGEGRGKTPAARAEANAGGERRSERAKGPPSDTPGLAVGRTEGATPPGLADKAEDRGPRGRLHSDVRELREEIKAGKLKKPDVEARLAKLRETLKDRIDKRRAAVKARWGEQLKKPETLTELALHGKRMAKLNRLLLLAQTERTGKDADKLTERVEKLIELETARHEKRMSQISSGAASPIAAQPAANTNEGAQ